MLPTLLIALDVFDCSNVCNALCVDIIQESGPFEITDTIEMVRLRVRPSTV